MCQKYTADELNSMNHETKNEVIYDMQNRLDKLEHDYENLIEQIRLANHERFGCHSETLNAIAGQLSFFNEAEACYDEQTPEPAIDEVIAESAKPSRKPKKKGQREEDLKDFWSAVNRAKETSDIRERIVQKQYSGAFEYAYKIWKETPEANDETVLDALNKFLDIETETRAQDFMTPTALKYEISEDTGDDDYYM